MNASWIEVNAADGGRFKAYLSLPPAGRGPGIVLIQEIFGVNAHIRAVADQYAMDGFTVLAPDVFWRSEPGVDIGYGDADRERGMALKTAMDLGRTVSDLAATVAALRNRPECIGRVASIGYCMGGMLSFQCAAHAGVDAAVCYYGGGIAGQLAEAAKIQCPVLFHFGETDQLIPVADAMAVRDAFAHRPDSTVHVYPGVGHGFNCWERASYDQTAAALARGRTLSFLATTL